MGERLLIMFVLLEGRKWTVWQLDFADIADIAASRNFGISLFNLRNKQQCEAHTDVSLLLPTTCT